MVNLDQNIFDRISVVPHSSEVALCKALEALEQAPAADQPKWLFRGQVRRQPLRRWPPVDEGAIKADSIEMEHLVPSDYRDLEKRLRGGESKAGLAPLYGDRPAHLRSALTQYIMQFHSAWLDAAVQDWLARVANSARPATLLSIGQHYGLNTHLLDWTADWKAALWFASHRWDNGAYVAGGDGVVYQLSLAALAKAADAANSALGITNTAWQCGAVDIRSAPALLAPRAKAQSGFSLVNLESPIFLQAIIGQGGLTVHTFPRATTPAAANSLTRDLLVPPLDEMALLFERARTDTAAFAQAIGWIATEYSALAATAADHSLIFP